MSYRLIAMDIKSFLMHSYFFLINNYNIECFEPFKNASILKHIFKIFL